MRLLVSWLREFVDVTASPEAIGQGLGLRGFELAGVEPLGNGDAVVDLEITANRPDCLSVVGLAREVATMYDLPLKEVPVTAADGGRPGPDAPRHRMDGEGHSSTLRLRQDARRPDAALTVTIDDVELCPRYAAAVAEIVPGAVAPPWMSDRLLAAGIRSIGAIVDITNYVLIELGHPTHAFDLDRLAGPAIRVRRARPGEPLTTLDGMARSLEPDMLVIADRDRAQALAGVMGGAAAEVSPATRTVVFESAYFQPASVRRTSKRIGLKTEASARFERGADVNAPIAALARIGQLMEQVGAGRVVAPLLDVYPAPREPVRIHLRRARLAAVLGADVPDADVDRILRRLGLSVAAAPDGWDVAAPTFRVDLLREVDLIEEVGRHFGFDRLPSTFPAVTAPAAPPDPRIPRDMLVRRVLTAAGLSEAVTFGIVESRAAAPFAGDEPPIPVANPLSAKFDVLRPSLVSGLIDAVAHNRRHGRDDVGLFEIGTTFSPAGEMRALGLAWTGAASGLHWSAPPREVDFFDVKGAAEQVCRALAVSIRFAPARMPFLVPGQTASILAGDGGPIGYAGQLLPSLADARGLPRQDRLFVAEVNLDRASALRATSDEAALPLPRHPFAVRDVSIVVPDTLPAETIRGTIQSAGAGAPAPLTAVAYFDRYRGQGVPDRSVSLSVRMTFQAPDRTLTDAEVQASVDAILAALGREHGAVQR